MYMPAPLKFVSFVNCTFDVHYCRVGLSADDEFVKVAALSALPSHHVEDGMHHVQKPGSDREDDDWYEEAPFGFVWDMKVLVAHLDFDLPHNTDRYGSPYEWLNKKMDEKNLIWPYPKRQVRWLMETLEALDGTVLQSVKNTDEDWVRCRKDTEFMYEESYRELDLTVKATFDERKLRTIDLAFLGGFWFV